MNDRVIELVRAADPARRMRPDDPSIREGTRKMIVRSSLDDRRSSAGAQTAKKLASDPGSLANSGGAAVSAVSRRLPSRPLEARGPRRRARLAWASAGAAVLAGVAVGAILVTTGASHGSLVENAYAALKNAAQATAASKSGVVIARISHNGTAQITNTLRWNGDDVSLASDSKALPEEVRFVDGKLYQRLGPPKAGSKSGQANDGTNLLDGRWRDYGSGDPRSFGQEWLAPTRADISGDTLKKIAAAMKDLKETANADGSTTSSANGTAAVIVGKTGFPYAIRPLGGADSPSTPVNIELTVGKDGIIRQLKASYGAQGSWVYSADYSPLGSAPAVTVPENAIDVAPPESPVVTGVH